MWLHFCLHQQSSQRAHKERGWLAAAGWLSGPSELAGAVHVTADEKPRAQRQGRDAAHDHRARPTGEAAGENSKDPERASGSAAAAAGPGAAAAAAALGDCARKLNLSVSV